ncbi:hypothetical protein ANO11243_051410 [Dothideomycetidae sp. 11243]|nr:hypothetical protein ANO11243_051410 [fungal sp. No.11243]
MPPSGPVHVGASTFTSTACIMHYVNGYAVSDKLACGRRATLGNSSRRDSRISEGVAAFALGTPGGWNVPGPKRN